MYKLHAWQFGIAAALTFSTFYVGCAIAVVLFPAGTIEFFNNWFHGLDLQLLKAPAGRALNLARFASGLASAAAVSFAAGAMLAGLYNVLSGRTSAR